MERVLRLKNNIARKNVVLIGFMGTGKSTLGRQLARRIGYDFIDTDLAIEEVTGKTVEKIFRKDGPIRFRSEENLLARKLSVRSGLVIATGGGMVLNSENVNLLKQNGVLIGLKAEAEIIFSRVRNKRRRPLLRRGNLRENVERLLREREGAYDAADFTIDTGKLSFGEALNEIHSYLKQEGCV
ncbi:shikimate kinase [Desulfotruncus arcticus]|uniref:shikimate kinase n=1 Tax=Desulfotruncus arcticus TaxID=341036 RepID=UPI002367740B|nr:shikimate kinase [Desulfotruncus arcticus]